MLLLLLIITGWPGKGTIRLPPRHSTESVTHHRHQNKVHVRIQESHSIILSVKFAYHAIS